MSKIIKRSDFLSHLKEELEQFPVVGLLGPRQCGKTTLAREYLNSVQEKFHYFDLEDPTDLRKLDSPKLALENLEGLVVIDEIQRAPDLFPLIRVLVDRDRSQTRFLILGSASRDLLQQSSETLAGRINYIELTPLNIREAKKETEHWTRGGFPDSFLAKSEEKSVNWRKAFISTFLERDISNLGFNVPAKAMRRFWTMLAHYHAQVMNYSELGRALDVSDQTVRRYLDLLEGTFMVDALTPWSANIKKRQIKSPKVYLRDSGILHALLGIENHSSLIGHPKCGASWEGYCIEEIKRLYPKDEHFFWATHQGAELDLLIVQGSKKLGFEMKFSAAPKITRSMKIAMETLELNELKVVVPGKESYKLSEEISVVGLSAISAQSKCH